MTEPSHPDLDAALRLADTLEEVKGFVEGALDSFGVRATDDTTGYLIGLEDAAVALRSLAAEVRRHGQDTKRLDWLEGMANEPGGLLRDADWNRLPTEWHDLLHPILDLCYEAGKQGGWTPISKARLCALGDHLARRLREVSPASPSQSDTIIEIDEQGRVHPPGPHPVIRDPDGSFE